MRTYFAPIVLFVSMLVEYIKRAFVFNGQLGGYVHDTAMSQFIPPSDFFTVTGTWTEVAGQVAGTIARHKAAAAETAVISIPICIPSNSVSGKGSFLKSIEVDYEILIADLTSIAAQINLVTRGVDTAIAVVTNPTFTQNPTPANAKVTDQHRLVITLDTPIWISNMQYVILQLTCVSPASTTLDMLGGFANYTARM